MCWLALNPCPLGPLNGFPAPVSSKSNYSLQQKYSKWKPDSLALTKMLRVTKVTRRWRTQSHFIAAVYWAGGKFPSRHPWGQRKALPWEVGTQWQSCVHTQLLGGAYTGGERWYQAAGNCFWGPAPSPLCWGYFLPLNWPSERKNSKVWEDGRAARAGQLPPLQQVTIRLYASIHPIQGSWINRDRR